MFLASLALAAWQTINRVMTGGIPSDVAHGLLPLSNSMLYVMLVLFPLVYIFGTMFFAVLFVVRTELSPVLN